MPINALVIGFTLYTAISTAGGITGGCINPAVGFIQPAFQRVFLHAIYPNSSKISLEFWPAYIFAPAIGGIFAGIFSRFVNEAALDAGEKAAKSED